MDSYPAIWPSTAWNKYFEERLKRTKETDEKQNWGNFSYPWHLVAQTRIIFKPEIWNHTKFQPGTGFLRLESEIQVQK